MSEKKQKDILYFGLPAILLRKDEYLVYSPYCREFVILKMDQINDSKITVKLRKKGFFGTTLMNKLSNRINSNSHIVTLVVTKKCNLKCRYCFANSSSKDNSNMSPEVASSIIKKISQQHTLSMVHFIGGEPTLNFPAIRSVIKCVDKLGIHPKFYITTNGIVSKSVLNWIVDNEFTFKISWDGITHDKMRLFPNGQGSRVKVEQTIEYLVDKDAHFCIRITVVRSNIAYLLESIQYLIEKGVKFFHIEPMSPDGRGVNIQSEVPTPNEFISIFSQIIILAEEKGVWVMTSALGNLFNPKDYFCCAPRNRVHHFNPDGSISLCYKVEGKNDTLADKFIKGNWEVNGNQLEIYQRDKIVNKLLTLTSSYYRSCRTCFLRFICSSGCPYRNLKEESEEEVDQWTCQIRKGILRSSILHLYKRALEGKSSCLEGIVRFYTKNFQKKENLKGFNEMRKIN
jgi:uncharacterized protein